MRLTIRIWLVGTAAAVVVALCASLAQAEFGVASFEAGTCKEEDKIARCTKDTPEKFYRQAAGHPNFGITDIKFNTVPTLVPGVVEPAGRVKTIRVDIPTGLSVDPEAVPKCTEEELEKSACNPLAKVGVDEITTVTEAPLNSTISATVYNIEPGPKHPGVPALFGFEIAPTLAPTYLVGGLSWHPEPESGTEFAPLGYPTGDYHEYFTIYEIPEAVPFIETRLITEGKAFQPTGTGPFLTLPSTCYEHPNPMANVLVESWKEERTERSFEAPVGATGCNEIPFQPEIVVTPATSQSDLPDGATIEVKVPHSLDPEAIDSSTLKDAHVSLPEGMTLNPSAANFIEACSDAQFGKGTANEVKCPPGSQVGADTIETPDLPSKTLVGAVYVGRPLSTDPGSGNEYRIFIDAEAPSRGVSVRLEGKVSADPSTGRLTTAVLENPQLPFSDFILSFNSGNRTPLANPLVCGPATTNASLTPYSGNPAAEPFMAFPVDFDGKGGSCSSPLPFSLTQSAAASPATGGASTTFAFDLARNDGEQYMSKLSTTLPAGLVGRIPAVTPCGEPQAAQGKCTTSSLIGTATVSVGSGPSPYTISGPAYITGPYGGAPYGLSVAVPAEKVGPFDYGTIVTRATVAVDPYTARIVVSSALPTIVGGVPLRMRALNVNVNRPNFMLTPTSCGPLTTDTTLTSTLGTMQSLSSPFQATNCGALAFKPKFTASSNAKTSRPKGASFTVKVGYPQGAQANIKSVFVSLPKHLPSRLSTLSKACLAEVFNANPFACPSASFVGSVKVKTPVLPDMLTGPAIFVSHGGAAFPDLDLVLKGDGVTVILVGNTNIARGVTTSNFASVPDVPVSSFEVKLPTGPYSALAAFGNLCKQKLTMPTTITAQNGKVIKQNTKISVSGCHKVHKHKHKRHHKGHRRHHRSHRPSR
jgi:hypothetical protein